MMANNGTGGRGARLGDEGEVADQPRRRNFTADKLTGYGLSLVVEDLEDVPEPPRPDNVEWSWDFAGSVRGHVRVSTASGADDGASKAVSGRVSFAMNTIDDTWRASASFEYRSDAVNATLSASGSSQSLASCEEEEEEREAREQAVDKTVMRVRNSDDEEGPEPTLVYGDVSFRLGGGGALEGRAFGERRCGVEREWHIETEIDDATIPLPGDVTVRLVDLRVVLDGYNPLARKETFEELLEYDDNLPRTFAAASLGGFNDTADAANKTNVTTTATTTTTKQRVLDWKVHVEGAGVIEFGGRGGGGGGDGAEEENADDDESAFMSNNVASVNVSIDARTDKATGDVVIGKAALRGDFRYATEDGALKVTGQVDIRLPCGKGAVSRPTFIRRAHSLEIKTAYYCTR